MNEALQKYFDTLEQSVAQAKIIAEKSEKELEHAENILSNPDELLTQVKIDLAQLKVNPFGDGIKPGDKMQIEVWKVAMLVELLEQVT